MVTVRLPKIIVIFRDIYLQLNVIRSAAFAGFGLLHRAITLSPFRYYLLYTFRLYMMTLKCLTYALVCELGIIATVGTLPYYLTECQQQQQQQKPLQVCCSTSLHDRPILSTTARNFANAWDILQGPYCRL